ncbi:MAG: cation-translocating P-type ATPase [Candidatus Delongbacteria bacterium]|nr:cation-translocating P-type ATPase [Candidatus Delongbacteria bacterium]
MKWYHRSIDEVIAYYSSGHHGLNEEQVERNRERFGRNQIATTRLVPFWRMLISQFADFVIWLLIIASMISFALGEIIDSLAIFTIIIVNALIGAYQEKRAQISLESLKRLSAPMARVIRNDQVLLLPSAELVCGDLVMLEAGDYVPADIRLIESHNFRIDESLLTGENLPVEKNSLELPGSDLVLSEQSNMAFMGTIVISGKGQGIAVHTGMNSELGKITGLVRDIEIEPTPLQQRMDVLGKYIAYFCIVISFLVVSVGYFTGLDLLYVFMLGVSLSVAAIPEGLPAIITITLAIGVYRMAKRHALIRKLPAVETLGSVNIICSDKTGTLTLNQMFINQVYTTDRKEYILNGRGFMPEGDILDQEHQPVQSIADHPVLEELIRCGCLCNDSELKAPSEDNPNWHVLGDPTEGALLTLAGKAGLDRKALQDEYPVIFQMPFDTDLKYMVIICRHHSGKLFLFMKGAPDVLLQKSRYLPSGKRITPDLIEDVDRNLADKARNGLRCLGMAVCEFESEAQIDQNDLFHQLVFLGFVAMYDPPRPEVRSAIQEARDAGIMTYMITGDHKLTAFSIGRELGLVESMEQVLTGSELETMSDEELNERIDYYRIYARTTPHHKLKIVRAAKNRGYLVAMTGDGVNDAPALREANIGIAMGLAGVDVARESADMVLTDDNYATIIAAVEEGRNIFANIRKSIFFILSHNVANILIVLTAIVADLKNLVSPIQLLWINLITDSLPALSFSAEIKEPDLMKRNSRDLSRSVLVSSDYWRLVWQGSLITIGSLMGYLSGWMMDTREAMTPEIRHEIARTMLFTIMVLGQQVQALNCRSHSYSIFTLGLFSNRYLIGAILFASVLQLIATYTPFLYQIFRIIPLNPAEMGIVLIWSLFPLMVVECIKWLKRKKKG